jgi:hypothetical protein
LTVQVQVSELIFTPKVAAGVVGGGGGGGRVVGAVVTGVVAGGLGVGIPGLGAGAFWVQPLATMRPARRTRRERQVTVFWRKRDFISETMI